MTDSRTVLLGVTSPVSLRLMEGFAQRLVALGWRVHVVSAPGPALDRLGSDPGIEVHPIPMHREIAPLSDLRALSRWIGVMRRVRPDLVSVGTPKAALLGGLAGLLTRVRRRVYLLRGLRLETATGVSRSVLSAAERITGACAHVIVAVSPSLRDRSVELELFPPRKVVVLGAGSSNGVDLAAFAAVKLDTADLRTKLGLDPAVPVVGFVGRLTLDKGLAVLARARDLLHAAGVDHHLLIVGRDEQGVLGRSVGTGRPAVVTGHVDEPERYFGLIDVLCLPTAREGMPNVVLEAAAAGVPTVTTRATGAVDAVVDGVTGFTVDVGDAGALAERLAQYIADPELRVAHGDQARAFVERHFARDLVWSRTEAFYRDLVDGGPA